jgi:hypothetical protein
LTARWRWSPVTLFTKSAALEFARKGYKIRVKVKHIAPTTAAH